VAHGSSKRLIYVCGATRCGTTMLDLILGHHPRGFSLGGVANWYHPWRTHHFDVKCSCGVYLCPLWEKFKNYPEEELPFQLLDQLKLDFLVDSSNSPPWVIGQNRRFRRRSEVRPVSFENGALDRRTLELRQVGA
jgi:hypothetical protein